MDAYCIRERRERHGGVRLFFNNKELKDEDIVSQNNIQSNSTLHYQVNTYFVNVFDSDTMVDSDYLQLLRETKMNQGLMRNMNVHEANRRRQEELEMTGQCTRVEVFDYWTISTIKETFARLTKKPFIGDDKILYAGHALEMNVLLWKLRIKDNQNLIISINIILIMFSAL